MCRWCGSAGRVERFEGATLLARSARSEFLAGGGDKEFGNIKFAMSSRDLLRVGFCGGVPDGRGSALSVVVVEIGRYDWHCGRRKVTSLGEMVFEHMGRLNRGFILNAGRSGEAWVGDPKLLR